MTYVIIWKNHVAPTFVKEAGWAEAKRDFKDKKTAANVVAIHVYGEDGKYDCDVNISLIEEGIL